jgi:LysM repeat protein
VSQIQELNPQILRGITPPKDSFLVRIPPGKADSFAVALAALPKDERAGLSRIESKKGQTLESIARRAGITARQLALFNPKLRALKSGRLAVGQMVLVPTEAVASAALPVPDPSIERYSRSRSTVLHVVKSGETLSGIAKKYHTTTAALMRANGLRRALIFPGQSLAVAGGRSARGNGPGARQGRAGAMSDRESSRKHQGRKAPEHGRKRSTKKSGTVAKKKGGGGGGGGAKAKREA